MNAGYTLSLAETGTSLNSRYMTIAKTFLLLAVIGIGYAVYMSTACNGHEAAMTLQGVVCVF